MKALIIGSTGQDGSYLCELLVAKGYQVNGIVRPSARPAQLPLITIHQADVTDPESLLRVMAVVEPDEVYNLAAQSHVGTSFEMPSYTMESTGCGALNVFEAVRLCVPHARIYQASSSEMFGNQPGPQSEDTPFHPVSPYACAKVFAHNTALAYREAYGLHISCGILFNHESPRRGENFVTRKICKALARIKAGLQDRLVLGNVDAKRDFGYAPEYVEAMWLMLQQEEPEDYVIGTGTSMSVWDFVELAVHQAGVDRSKVCAGAGGERRPTDIAELWADASKAREVLGWEATTTGAELVRIMMQAEMKAVGL